MSIAPAYPKIRDGRVGTGQYLFVRPRAGLSDRALLDAFDFETYRAVSQVHDFDRYAVPCDAGDRLLVAHDMRCSLFHARVTASPAFAEPARHHQIFVCVDGDRDRSFEYRHFVNGALARDVVVDSPRVADRKVVRHGRRAPWRARAPAAGLRRHGDRGRRPAWYPDAIQRRSLAIILAPI